MTNIHIADNSVVIVSDGQQQDSSHTYTESVLTPIPLPFRLKNVSF